MKITEKLKTLLEVRRVKLRDIARVLGLLQSCSRALGNVVRIKTRNLYRWLNERLENSSYNYHFCLSEVEKDEVFFWINNIRDLNGCYFTPKRSSTETYFSVVSDASNEGMFAYQLENWTGLEYQVSLRELFSAQEAKCSSTVRELLALQNIYCSELGDRFMGSTVYHYQTIWRFPPLSRWGRRNPICKI